MAKVAKGEGRQRDDGQGDEGGGGRGRGAAGKPLPTPIWFSPSILYEFGARPTPVTAVGG